MSLHTIIPNWLDAKLQVPAFKVMGEEYMFESPVFETAMHTGIIIDIFRLDLMITYIPEESHFVQDQLPELLEEP